jgi:hypothetical protein
MYILTKKHIIMKNTFIKILFTFSVFTTTILSCKAQSNTINITEHCNNTTLSRSDGELYLKDINNLYTPYVGTWKWTEGNREFTLTLIKQTRYHYNLRTNNYYQDRIVGYYIYKENNVEIINTSNNDLSSFSPNVDYSLNCYSILTGKIHDTPKNKGYDSWFEIISPTQIRFKGKEGENLRYIKQGVRNLPTVYSGNSFPLEMVLTKQ